MEVRWIIAVLLPFLQLTPGSDLLPGDVLGDRSELVAADLVGPDRLGQGGGALEQLAHDLLVVHDTVLAGAVLG